MFWCQAVDVHFSVDVSLAETVKLGCNGSLDVIFGVLAEAIFIEVLKFDGLLDEVLLKLLFLLVNVGGYLKYATVLRDVHEVLTKKFLMFFFMTDVDDVGCFWWRSTRWIVALAAACLLVDVLLEVLEVLELLVPLEVVLEVEVLVVVLPVVSP